MFWQASFLCAVGRLGELPPQDRPELAVLGRSNVGKSSAINALTGRRRLAYVSKTPGRTQTINFFELDGGARLADLPGYGYARVPQAQRAQWDLLVGGYVRQRARLAALVLIVDVRHGLTDRDARLLEWLRPLARPLLVLLSKCDKLSRTAQRAALAQMRPLFADAGSEVEVRLFSSLSGEGVDEARALLEAWLRTAQPGPEIKSPRQRGCKPGAKTP